MGGINTTIQEAKKKLIGWVKAEVGYPEGSNNWNKYAPIVTPLIGWNAQSQPWCDIFTDAAFIRCFGLADAAKMTYQPIGSGSAACRYSAQFFKDNGAWSSSPEAGAVIFFYYDGAINHQGIVTDVSGGLVHTVEGNSGDKVSEHTYVVGDRVIAGYGIPKWSVVTDGEDQADDVSDTNVGDKPVEVCTFTAHAPTLLNGSKGSWVKILQLRLIDKGYPLPKWGADGDFGSETQNAVERFQSGNGIVVDSVVGQATWVKLFEV